MIGLPGTGTEHAWPQGRMPKPLGRDWPKVNGGSQDAESLEAEMPARLARFGPDAVSYSLLSNSR